MIKSIILLKIWLIIKFNDGGFINNINDSGVYKNINDKGL